MAGEGTQLLTIPCGVKLGPEGGEFHLRDRTRDGTYLIITEVAFKSPKPINHLKDTATPEI